MIIYICIYIYIYTYCLVLGVQGPLPGAPIFRRTILQSLFLGARSPLLKGFGGRLHQVINVEGDLVSDYLSALFL